MLASVISDFKFEKSQCENSVLAQLSLTVNNGCKGRRRANFCHIFSTIVFKNFSYLNPYCFYFLWSLAWDMWKEWLWLIREFVCLSPSQRKVALVLLTKCYKENGLCLNSSCTGSDNVIESSLEKPFPALDLRQSLSHQILWSTLENG